MGKKRNRKTFLIAMGFILPFFILYTIFTIWPVVQGFYVSLHKWGLMGKLKYVGFDNYTKFLGDKNFWGALVNGVLHSLGVLPSSEELQWLQDPKLVWVTVSLMTVWWTVGFSMLLYLSALQDISQDVYEAAAIDGASGVQQLFRIVIPLLKPTTWLVLLLQMIGCFKVFGQIYMITGGGPASSTRPLIQYIYENAFGKSNMGYAAAMSYVLFGILLILSLGQQILQRKGEE